MQENGNRNGPRTPRERLEALGIQLPTPPTPLGNYVETSLVGTLLFTSGILPFVDGKLLFTGRLGADLTVKQGQEATRSATLNALAAASHFLGDIDCLRKVVRAGFFDRFYRVPDRNQRAIPGLGVGLYIVAEIVKHLEGTASWRHERRTSVRKQPG